MKKLSLASVAMLLATFVASCAAPAAPSSTQTSSSAAPAVATAPAASTVAGTSAVAENLSGGSNSGYDVQSYYGTYDVKTKKAGHPATSLTGPKTETWNPPAKANKTYTIGVSFPHLKDPYWLAVDYGIIAEAKKLGVNINLVAAQGYNDLTGQINQVNDLSNRNVDGMILAAISYSSEDQLVSQLRQKMPVLEVINDIQASAISAKALVSFYDMGYSSGEYVASQVKNNSTPAKVVFLPGPAGSGWAPDTLSGFQDAVNKLAPGKVNIVDVKWGDTGKDVQLSLIEDMLNAHPDMDYLVGNAVAADAAPDAIANRAHKPKIVSTYITPPVYDDVVAGKVVASPVDFTALQGRMAVDMMVRILNGEQPGKDFPFRSGPIIKVLTTDNYKQFSYEDMFGSRGFRPVFTYRAGQ